MVSQDAKKRVDLHQTQLSFNKETLLQLLVESAATSAATNVSPKVLQISDASVNEIILEFELDGIRHCLIRCKPNSQNFINLSSRELEIAKLIAQGLPNKCIGSNLKISPWTVNTHLRRIFVKLGVTSRTAMVMRLMEAGLLQREG